MLDRRIKETGHENIYLPLLVPESLPRRRSTSKGSARRSPGSPTAAPTEPAERLAIRPTSEAMVGAVYRDLIQSYRDLPVLRTRANVVRWELRTRPFLRTAEFQWQEGHTFHATAAEAREESERMLGVYREIWRDWLAIHDHRPQERGREVPGGRGDADGRGAHGRSTGAADGHQPRPRRELRPGVRHPFLDRDNERRHPLDFVGFSWRTIGA